ncbi:MAG: leucine--tRNA ligase, partial [Nitrosopumilus sp.]|nr:leucine--tRNA ligase [Nitrosopumilus sp.]
DYIIPTATLRPETIFGVVNLWVNPEIIYKKITVDDEKWIVSSECAYKLEFLDKKISYEGEIKGSELVGKSVIIPHRNESIVMFPASFVESETGTGMVMSVPAHAPFDYQALIDLKRSEIEPELVSQINQIKPISIIDTQGYGEIPAKEAVEQFGVQDQNDPKLEEATKEVYGKEFYGGKLKENTEQFSGIKVAYAKDTIKEWLIENKHAEILLELTNTPVRCRCGAKCVVKVLNNQWFLNYKDQDWKDKATQCFNSMNILPQEIKSEFNYVIGWLRERACARQHGLGTKLPWDKDWIVESLSDSVIYMAYYTISKFVNDKRLTPENLSDEFFDHIFLGKGDVAKVSNITKISTDVISEIKKEFEYFYPVDSRHSGRDLVPNHLTFFVLNHVAIFPEKNWPREIVVNGSVLMDGSKMSKSMGNIIPLRKAIAEYGADPIRLAIIISAELLQDADFNIESVSGIQGRLNALLEECSRLKAVKIDNLEPEDKWIKSKTQSLISQVTYSLEKMRLREALHDILYSFESDLSWYEKRANSKNRKNISGILHEIYSTRVAMLSPFAPHIAEEMWEKLGNIQMVSTSSWPEFSQVDAAAILSEELLKSIIEDISNILKVTKITPQKIIIYTANSFKSKVYHAALEKMMTGQTNMGEVMRDLISNPDTQDVKKNPDFVQKTIKDILSESPEIRNIKQASKIDEKSFLVNELLEIGKKEFGVEIIVCSESDSDIYDPKGKAKYARPYKPAILIE